MCKRDSLIGAFRFRGWEPRFCRKGMVAGTAKHLHVICKWGAERRRDWVVASLESSKHSSNKATPQSFPNSSTNELPNIQTYKPMGANLIQTAAASWLHNSGENWLSVILHCVRILSPADEGEGLLVRQWSASCHALSQCDPIGCLLLPAETFILHK